MMDNNVNNIDRKQNYREAVSVMGKKEFTLLKMQEYGFWPKDLPTPYERQKSETQEEYENRKALLEKYHKVINQINDLCKDKEDINNKLKGLQKKYDDTWDYEKIRKDVAQTIMKESIERRKEVKILREIEKKEKSDAWKKNKSENIVYIGKGYSKWLYLKDTDEEKLKEHEIPIIKDDKELAQFLGIEYRQLRFLTYHRDVVKFDNYTRYTIPKKKGGVRNIAAPKKILKDSQRKILDEILCKIEVSESANGFIQGKSVVSGAESHIDNKVELLINMDLENFFPTITFERVRGMFQKLGYSGYVSSLLAMICTYCERMEMEIKGEKVYVKTTDRILPQGAPSSPMITNIICSKLDKRLKGLADKYGLVYSRYADDMSFSFGEGNIILNAINKYINLNTDKENNQDDLNVGKIIGIISKIIKEEGFNINNQKTKFLRKNNRQSITGIVINND
ncbi:MAG TPA: reverse transcriptase, partial [Clostridium sp.]|nr:reverse transcriptase [Clostridium sp.]